MPAMPMRRLLTVIYLIRPEPFDDDLTRPRGLLQAKRIPTHQPPPPLFSNSVLMNCTRRRRASNPCQGSVLGNPYIFAPKGP